MYQKTVLFIAFFLSICFSSMTAVPHSKIIPAPQQISFGEGHFEVQGKLKVFINAPKGEQKAIKRHLNALEIPFKSGRKQTAQLLFLKVAAKDKFSSPEAYGLNITTNKITIEASAAAGFFYGLQSLSQLKQTVENKTAFPETMIYDSPRYDYRGFMMDVSRHFYDIDFLKKQIDAMAHYKLNRLHLHLTDAAGWRLEIKQYDRLTSLAAWRPEQNWKKWWFGDRRYVTMDNDSAQGGFYTQTEMKELVRYAQDRFITIIPEIEMPAHSEEIMAAYPYLSCENVDFRNGDVCVGKESTYTFFEKVLEEVIDVFPSQYIHIGADEAGKRAWKSCGHCNAIMKGNELANYEELQAYFIGRINRFLESKGRKMIGWDEITEGELAKNATVMVWRNIELAEKALQNGNPVVMSPGEFCYLDAYQDAPHMQPEAIGGYLPLEKIYSYNPSAQFPIEQQTLVKGVQANLWTEYVPNAAHAEKMIWPRLLALSEVGWTQPAQKSWADFRTRALTAVDDLTAKGYQAFDLKNEIGNRPETMTTISHGGKDKKVSYILDYSSSYPASAEATLTDGLRGGWTYNDKRWQGFIGPKRMEVVVDMDSVQVIRNIACGFMQSAGAEVYLPTFCEFSVSTDGVNFIPVYKESQELDLNKVIAYQDVEWKGQSAARYIKVKALASQAHGGWVFADEIMINRE